MKRPDYPDREPDYKISSVSFWWKEKLLGNVICGCFELDLDTWSYYSYNYDQYRYITVGFDIELNKVKDAYYTWLIEKELSR